MMKTRWLTRGALAVSIGSAFSGLGCSGAAASEQTASVTAAATTTRAPIGLGSHGLVRLVGQALGDVPLIPAQRVEIEKLSADAEAGHAPVRAARADFLTTLATQVEAGNIDRTVLQSKFDALTAAAATSQPADRAGFERLHAILNPDQRTEFIDAFVAHLEGEVHPADHAHAAHSWGAWAEELNLTADQRAQIRVALAPRFDEARQAHEKGASEARWAEAKERRTKVFTAFKQDRFVFDEVAPPIDVRAGAAHKGDEILVMAEKVVPLLTSEQRGLAAQKLRTRAADAESQGDVVP